MILFKKLHNNKYYDVGQKWRKTRKITHIQVKKLLYICKQKLKP